MSEPKDTKYFEESLKKKTNSRMEMSSDHGKNPAIEKRINFESIQIIFFGSFYS